MHTMQSMEPDATRQGGPGTSYGPFTGNRSAYDDPQRPANTYDDAFVEALAQRLTQRLSIDLAAKIAPKNAAPSPGMRLALAIVSLIALIGLTAISLGISAANHQIWVGFICTFVICMAVCIINIVYNVGSR